MLKLESLQVEEMRGIRKLQLVFDRKSFSISGPNGSGKSGIIDAIEFGLTGQITRLSGQGAKDLSISKHGPHVDAAQSPESAFVKLQIFLTRIEKSVTITRCIASPTKPTIEPPDPDVLAELATIAQHPEIAISRREILRFVIAESSKRSEEVQALLKLDEVGQLRSFLKTAKSKLESQRAAAESHWQTVRDGLQRHLQISDLSGPAILLAVNTQRATLGLPSLTEFTPTAELDAGVSSPGVTSQTNKESALRDLQALSAAIAGFPALAGAESAAILADLRRFEHDPPLRAAIQTRALLENGLALIEGPECPLCDSAWLSDETLRDHLEHKLSKSTRAQKILDSLLAHAAALAGKIIPVTSLLGTVQQTANEDAFAGRLARWQSDLQNFQAKLASFEGILQVKNRLAADPLDTPADLAANLQVLTEQISALPDPSATFAAQTFLSTAQSRLADYQTAHTAYHLARTAFARAEIAYRAYCDAMESELKALYAEVESDFHAFYRAMHGEDEANFTAKLIPNEGCLDFKVDFYGRGPFPPTAYHSEGHQDSMGVCLYLALRKHQPGVDFTFALLDDVLTSIDIDHRRAFCLLLRENFPNTQFLITTHDRVWAEQMKVAGLVNKKTSVVVQNWNVDAGPVVESLPDVWEDVTDALAKEKVSLAAAMLRRHLECVFRDLAGTLGAELRFRPRGDYELGHLCDKVIGRLDKLYGSAISSAHSWDKPEKEWQAEQRRAALSEAKELLKSADAWTLNSLVHYNEWANLSPRDFAPVVAGYQQILSCFQCEECSSWLFTAGRPDLGESLRCACNHVNLNLTAQAKRASSAG